jgi:PKD repeat protein
MVEKEEASAKKSWWKGILGAVGGMISGVAVMYLTPWVDKVAKPAKPVANFSVDYDGSTVRFHNLSPTSVEGWWDFGDGSPLVPVSTDNEFINHTYPRPGDYTAKLSLRNQLGEEDDRSVPIRIDTKPAMDAPQVVSLQAVPAHQCDKGAVVYAPATFRLVSKVEHADLCMLDLGNDRPCEVMTDPALARCQHVTFDKPGRYVVKLIAIHGTQHDERTATVTVAEAPANSISVILNVTDDATRIETTDRQANLGVTFPADFLGNVLPFEKQFAALPGFTIADVRIPPPIPTARETRLGNQPAMALDAAGLGIRSAQKLRLQLSADRKHLTVSGELVRQSDASGHLGHAALAVPLVLIQQRRQPAHQTNAVSATLTLPAAALSTSNQVQLPSVPQDWVDCQRNVRLEMRAGDQVVWQDSQLPHGSPVTVAGRRCLLTATVVNDEVRIDLADVPLGLPSTLR